MTVTVSRHPNSTSENPEKQDLSQIRESSTKSERMHVDPHEANQGPSEKVPSQVISIHANSVDRYSDFDVRL